MSQFDPAYYANARREIGPLLPDGATSVLEIGCSGGNTLAWLGAEKGYTRCCGVEQMAGVAKHAQDMGLNVVVADIENEPMPFEGQFDLVLCLDVLEHLLDPWLALRKIRDSVRPGGHLIASIPNVSHVSVLGGLLLRNAWRYEDSGVLDRTHLRFFTGATMRELVRGADLELLQQKGRIARKTHRRLNVLTFGLFSRFFTLQYLLLAQRPADD